MVSKVTNSLSSVRWKSGRERDRSWLYWYDQTTVMALNPKNHLLECFPFQELITNSGAHPGSLLIRTARGAVSETLTPQDRDIKTLLELVCGCPRGGGDQEIRRLLKVGQCWSRDQHIIVSWPPVMSTACKEQVWGIKNKMFKVLTSDTCLAGTL